MNKILYQALRIKNSEKKVLSITQFIDTIRDYYAYDTKEIAFITSKEDCRASTFGYVCTFSEMLDCETHKNLMSDEIIKDFDEKGYDYKRVYLNSYLYNKMAPSSNVVLIVNLTPQSYNGNIDKSHYYYNVKVVNVPK